MRNVPKTESRRTGKEIDLLWVGEGQVDAIVRTLTGPPAGPGQPSDASEDPARFAGSTRQRLPTM